MSCGSAFQTKRSSTRVGIARKTQMYVHAAARTTRNRLSRSSATTSPMTKPRPNETTVSETVTTRPSRRARDVSASRKIWTSTRAGPHPAGLRFALLDGIERRRVHLVLRRDGCERAIGLQGGDRRRQRRADVGLALAVVHAVVLVVREGEADLVVAGVLQQPVGHGGVSLPDRVDAAEHDLLELIGDLRV